MAEIKSLGVHTPVALPYLISEGVLPEERKKGSYQWETYVVDGEDGDVEEEILATKRCVVWSQGNSIQNVYRFELEGEDVVQALLTEFPSPDILQQESSQEKSGSRNASKSNSQSKRASRSHGDHSKQSRGEDLNSTRTRSNRALVVFLKSKVHIHFLHGASHIIDLPFEVQRAFAAPRGVLLQRRVSQTSSLPHSPQAPAAPPNSFFSSQLQPSSSYLQSPTLAKSFGSTQPSRPSPLSGNNGSRLDALFQDVLGSPSKPTEDDLAPLYSLTNPLSDFGVVTFSLQHQRPRLSNKTPATLSVEFEPLDAAEEILYASPKDELANSNKQSYGSLMLIVTVNHDLQTLTIWHAWYVEDRSLAALMKQRAAHKAAKARRRSSFLSANMGTGTATPAVRHREATRESFAAAGSMRLPGEPATAASSRKPTRQEEEEAMASQMDPDYQPAGSQQNARESRRVSSLNADVRASQNAANASFSGPAGRRQTSFGGPNERRSLGHRRSRGSTPGSVFSRSLGPEDDSMDIDSSMDAEGEETVERVIRHIRATFEAAGAESLFGSMDGGFKRDLIARKVHSSPIASTSSPHGTARKMRVVTFRDHLPLHDSQNQGLNVYIHDQSTLDLTCFQMSVRHKVLWPELQNSPYVAVPVITGEKRINKVTDVAKLHDSGTDAILLADRGLITSLDHQIVSSVRPSAPYRAYSALDISSSQSHLGKDVGKNRTLKEYPPGAYELEHIGASGRFDEAGADGISHRRQMTLRPRDRCVHQLLEVCRVVLPEYQSQMVSDIWYHAHSLLLERMESLSTSHNIEWIALAATVFFFVLDLVDGKTKAALNMSGIAVGTAQGKKSPQLKRQHRTEQLCNRPSWSWMDDETLAPTQRITTTPSMPTEQDRLFMNAAEIADEILRSQEVESLPKSTALDLGSAAKLLLGLHVFNEERKLCTLPSGCQQNSILAAIIAQLGGLLDARGWSYNTGEYYNLEGACKESFLFVESKTAYGAHVPLMDEPVGVFQWFEHSLTVRSGERYPSLDVIAALGRDAPLSQAFSSAASRMTPRIVALSDVLVATEGVSTTAIDTVQSMALHGLTLDTIETLPESIAAPFREAIARCERDPPTTWPANLLSLVGRGSLSLDAKERVQSKGRSQINVTSSQRDIQTVCHAIDHPSHNAKTSEASRHAVSQLIFSEDRRLVEATSLMHYNSVQVAECTKQPDWSDAYHFEQQRRVMQWVTMRMIALPPGDAMLHFDSQTPLLTDKYHLPGFSSSCLMQPMGHTLTTDRSGLTEEKVNWAYFHAGVSAGLRISKDVKGIDTSWIAFNKPNELTNRHAGLLLALGLNGHLRNVAKWLSFKYLTPKHTMTSVGLLLGLSASSMGTMDSLITRMLSVHITRMLPPGAAELNVSPTTQTAGLMGIGLLYYNTQHRRMSEIMLSEVEHMEAEDPDSGPDPLRDESYRLAAGFALGFINLGKGQDLRGLRGMYLPERLLAVAVGPRPVNAVHIFDRATAGAVMAIALVYMKSGDKVVARKIDIPDTEAQFDHVRPDVLMLRAMAKHLIMWDQIEVKPSTSNGSIPQWTYENLPASYRPRFQESNKSFGRNPIKSSDVPFFNIVTGLVWALSLKYAGSRNVDARNEILTVLDYFYKVRAGADAHYYDAKLAKSTVRRCIDVLALSAAVVMAGSGDLRTFRYLRRLHGRTDAETPYGSHLAAHLAIGVLFLGGGTYTFGTSDLAIASLLCAFYPLFPIDVHDNHVHLQAFRHFWVFAAEARCIIVEDVDTQRPVSIPIIVKLKDGTTKDLTAPCLLPEFNSIAMIQTNDPTYWRVTLDLASNSQHLTTLKQDQRIRVQHCPASEAHNSIFASTSAALNDALSVQATSLMSWQSIFNLEVFKELDKADIELILPPDIHSSLNTDDRGTVVDDHLVLSNAAYAREKDALWNLRLLFAWAERAKADGEERFRWIGDEVIEALKARVEQRLNDISASVL